VPAAFAFRPPEPIVYARRHPERTSLYEVVRDNLETLYGAIADGALDVRLAKHQRRELEAYLDCGLLCRGFARLRCSACKESRLVAFSCKEQKSIRRFLRAIGEPTDVPTRSPSRGPPYWRSTVLRKKALGEVA
jgi:hypothetical protein